MIKVLNFGSINIDNVFTVDHFVQPGETLGVESFRIFPGGKGQNQSIALAKAGCDVYLAACIGKDGEWVLDGLRENNVNTDLVTVRDCDTGKAVVQVNKEGQNCILYYEGANNTVDEAFIDRVLADFGRGDLLVLQNEINMLDRIIDRAYGKGMVIALNPSPVNDALKACDLRKISYLLLNEIEGEVLTGSPEPEKMLDELSRRYPDTRIILTLGGDGAYYKDRTKTCRQEAFKTEVVDTTAAGDTFSGYFLKCHLDKMSVEEALKTASFAASIAVSRKGAAVSIPLWLEVAGKLGLDK